MWKRHITWQWLKLGMSWHPRRALVGLWGFAILRPQLLRMGWLKSSWNSSTCTNCPNHFSMGFSNGSAVIGIIRISISASAFLARWALWGESCNDLRPRQCSFGDSAGTCNTCNACNCSQGACGLTGSSPGGHCSSKSRPTTATQCYESVADFAATFSNIQQHTHTEISICYDIQYTLPSIYIMYMMSSPVWREGLGVLLHGANFFKRKTPACP